jgi:hypothetical protein
MGSLWLSQPQRGLKTVDIKWKRPEKIQSIDPRNSGDLEKLPKVDDNAVYQDFQNVSLEEYTHPKTFFMGLLIFYVNRLSPEQRKLYTLKYLPLKYTNTTILNNVLSEVQRHKLDLDSMEARSKDIN